MKSEILDRAPPSKIECEKSLLGAIVLQPSILPELIEAGFRGPLFLAAECRSLANHLLASTRPARRSMRRSTAITAG